MPASSPPDDDRPLPLAQQLAEEIRRLRKAAGLSQPRLAALIGYTRQYVSLAERPKRGLLSAELVTAIDDALGAGGALVVLRQQADAERKARRPTFPPTNAATTAGDGPSPLGAKNTNHSELMSSAAAITFGASPDQPAETIIATADQPWIPTRVRAGDVRRLRRMVEVLEEWDHHAGGGTVRHHALATLRSAIAMRRSAGYHMPAQQLFLLGLQVTRESEDRGVRAHVASGLARQGLPDARASLRALAPGQAGCRAHRLNSRSFPPEDPPEMGSLAESKSAKIMGCRYDRLSPSP
ncbi:MAG: helix-turn-helix domain-containing protein [Pseudonocardiaceae bacterium]